VNKKKQKNFDNFISGPFQYRGASGTKVFCSLISINQCIGRYKKVAKKFYWLCADGVETCTV